MANLYKDILGALPQPVGGDVFGEKMPYYDSWEQLEPFARQQAASMVNPEAMRQFDQAQQGYMSGMASSGGGRFGRAWGGMGGMEAEAERNRQAQMQDLVNLYQQGYTDMFYNPAQEAWGKGLTQAKAPVMPILPGQQPGNNLQPVVGQPVPGGGGGQAGWSGGGGYQAQPVMPGGAPGAIPGRGQAGNRWVAPGMQPRGPVSTYNPVASPFVGTGGALTNYQRPRTNVEKQRIREQIRARLRNQMGFGPAQGQNKYMPRDYKATGRGIQPPTGKLTF